MLQLSKKILISNLIIILGLFGSDYFTNIGYNKEFAKHGITDQNQKGLHPELAIAYQQSTERIFLSAVNWISFLAFFYCNPIFGYQFLRILLSKTKNQA